GWIREIQNGVAARPERDTLVDRRQVAAAPVRVAAAGTFSASAEDDEAGQVLRFAAQAVQRPSAEPWLTDLLRAGAPQNLAGRVIERIGHHRFHDGDIVNDFGQMREQLRKLRATLATLIELETWTEQLRVRIDKRGSITLEQFGRWQRTIELRELR